MYVYVAVDAPQCKIGYTKDPNKRAKWLYNPCHYPRRKWRPKIRRIWPLGELARDAEKAIKRALASRCPSSSPEWFEIGWREMYRIVDDCVMRIAGRKVNGIRVSMIGKTLTWRDVEEVTTISTATLRRHYK